MPRPDQRVETTGRRGDGSQFPMEMSLSAVERDGRVELTAFLRDLTERRRAEDERARLLHEAREANRMKDDFLATLSHELRTPLNAIVGWAHLLRTGALDEPTRDRAVETIERNARVQSQLIGDILDISRIVAGKLRLEMKSLDPHQVVESALDTLRPSADAKGVQLAHRSDPATGPLWGDPDRLQQIVWNLLSNSIRFTPAGGVVTLSLSRREDEIGAGWALITVRDTGAGISPDFLPHVFERFRQGGGQARRSGGLGLGLAIVRSLVEMHGGRVEAESAGPGLGAAFHVWLPLMDVSREQDAAADDVASQVAGGGS
jgi:signal transduction histidine kinase